MSRHFTVGTIVGLQLLAASSVAAAAPPGQSCTGIANDAERLACYDQAFGRGVPASSAGAGAPAATADAATAGAVAAVDPAEKARREFGLSEEGKRALDENKSGPVEPESLTAKVKGVSRRPTGEQVFVLENGQVWVETSTYTAARAQPGDEVTVRKGALGSYLLVTPKRVATHVRRVK